MSKDTTFLMALVHLIWIIEAFHTPNINGVTSNSRIHTKTIAQQLSKDDWFKLKHRATKLNLYNDEINEDENKGNASKNIITALSSIGVAETLYLTWSKLSSSSVLFCTEDGGGCGDVLNGPYSSLSLFSMDIPLPLFGVLAYGLAALLSRYENRENELLLLLTTSMATFSSILVYLLFFVIHDLCPYCILSASLSFTLFILAFRLNSGENEHFLKSTIPKVFGAVAATALSSFLLFSNVSNDPALYANAKATTEITQDNAQKEFEPPQITTTSSSTAIALGKTLQSLDAKMYGAYWCSHCYEQKQTLGKEVFSKDYVSYIECDKEGMNSKRSLCKERRVPGYPTWEIGGKLFPGEQSIEELQDLALEMKSALSIK